MPDGVEIGEDDGQVPTGGELASTERDSEVTTAFVQPSEDSEPPVTPLTRPLVINGVYHGEVPVEGDEEGEA